MHGKPDCKPASSRAPTRRSDTLAASTRPGHHHPQGVHEQVAFAPFDPFVPIETTGASALGGLDRLTVQDDHRRAGQAAAAQARLLMKRPFQFGRDARIFPGTKVLVNGARARELAG